MLAVKNLIFFLFSKRKRQADTDDYTQADQEPVSNYRKRLKVQKNDDFNDTLNELFPPVSSSNIGVRKRVSSIKTSKKRLSTIGTQYEAMGNVRIGFQLILSHKRHV